MSLTPLSLEAELVKSAPSRPRVERRLRCWSAAQLACVVAAPDDDLFPHGFPLFQRQARTVKRGGLAPTHSFYDKGHYHLYHEDG